MPGPHPEAQYRFWVEVPASSVEDAQAMRDWLRQHWPDFRELPITWPEPATRWSFRSPDGAVAFHERFGGALMAPAP